MNTVIVTSSFACEGIAHAINTWSTSILHTNNAYQFLWTSYGELNLQQTINSSNNASCPRILLIRLQDLVANHPEILQSNVASKSKKRPRTTTTTTTTTTDPTSFSSFSISDQQLTTAADRLISLVSSSQNTAPLLLLIVPPPPSECISGSSRNQLYETLEQNIYNSLHTFSHIHVELSTTITTHLMPDYYKHGYSKENDLLSHSPYTTDARIHIAGLCWRLLLRATMIPSFPKKVYAIDCDNTLWDGILGEDGLHQIHYGQSAQHRLWFHQYLLKRQQKGMLLCLVSKNEDVDVFKAFQTHYDGTEWLLNIDTHIVARQINWNEKYNNISTLSNDLNINMNDFIFIDDSPVECMRAKELNELDDERNGNQYLCVVNIPFGTNNVQELRQFITNHWCFDESICIQTKTTTRTKTKIENKIENKIDNKTNTETKSITETDRTRTELYKQVAKRQQAKREAVVHASAFLASLNLVVDFLFIDNNNIERAVQLIARTNQMQTRKLPLLQMKDISKDTKQCLLVQCRDRFGDHGIIGFIQWKVITKSNTNIDTNTSSTSSTSRTSSTSGTSGKSSTSSNTSNTSNSSSRTNHSSTYLSVERFCLSCRSMNVGVEHVIMRRLSDIAMLNNCDHLSFVWRPTSRSMPMYAFLNDCGASFSTDQQKEIIKTAPQKVHIEQQDIEIETTDANNIGFIDGIGLRDIYSKPVPNDLLHLSKKKQKKEMKNRYFQQKKLDNPTFSMRAWRKLSRISKESKNIKVQQKKATNQKSEQVDQFMYDVRKHGVMPMNGYAVVSLEGAAGAVVRPPILTVKKKKEQKKDKKNENENEKMSTSAETSAKKNVRDVIQTSDGRIRSLTSSVYQEIANVYSNKDQRRIFFSKMRLMCRLDNENENMNDNEDKLEEETEDVNQRHRKRTKLRQHVKTLIQENNSDTYMKDVKLFKEE